MLHDLTSNIIYRVARFQDEDDSDSDQNSKFMGCERGVVEELCELYPKTALNLRMRSLEKRAVYLYYMDHPESLIKRSRSITMDSKS